MKSEITVLLLSLLVMTGTVAAVTYIYSNQVTVTVQDFTVSLSPESQTIMKGQNATFQARVLAAGVPQAGITVNLMDADGNTTLSTSLTDASGYANFVVLLNVTAGDYHFKAEAEIPDF